MKTANYTLSEEVNGISSLRFIGPTRKNIDFFAKVKQGFIQAAMKAREKDEENGENPASDDAEDENKSEQEQINELAQQLITLTYVVDDFEIGGLLIEFSEIMTDTPFCTSQGSPVPADFWDSCPMEDLEGAFGAYLANFIMT